MYRHVAPYHLDLGQLWRCPVFWCTVWKGTPQDCMDDVRGAHDVPWDIKSASLEKLFPPWTVKRKIWTDALKPCHSGVSTDVLLFSDINYSCSGRTLTVQDILDLVGAIVYDCRPPLLPVSLRLKDIGQLPRSRPVSSRAQRG